MADVQPFRGMRYSAQLIKDLGDLLCPPYDVISPELQGELHDRSPYNAVRLELGVELPTDSEAANRYTRAASLLEEWLAAEVLLPESTAVFYLLQEEFPHLGRGRTRHSILARVRLEEYSRRVVLPHEETSQGPKKDRLELLSATGANLSPILAIYSDPSRRTRELIERTTLETPLFNTGYSDTRIRMWAISDEGAVETVRESLRDAPIYLADGHHRYETALRYREMQRAGGVGTEGEAGHDFVMMSLIDVQDPGLLVLPYHRVLKGLSPDNLERVMGLVRETFDIQPLDTMPGGSGDAGTRLEERIEAIGASQVVLGLLEHGPDRASLLTLREPAGASPSPLERCATWVLGRKVLEPVLGTQQEAVEKGILHFTHDSGEVSSLMKSGDFQLGFVLPPMPLDLFEEVVLSGERLPLKSTYFSPKLPTGLVINRLV
jgi:uncharacterized protein (DUF1015 family)